MLDTRLMLTRIFFAVLLAALGGCHNDSSSTAVSNSAGGSVSTSPGSTTTTTIAGTPAATATVGSAYEFMPVVTADPSAELSFAISNQPSWASFSPTTGKLSGTPTSADVGEYKNISIEVKDGASNAALTTFSIDVKLASEVATITWEAPSEVSGVTGVMGYHVYYGSSASSMTHVIDISNTKDTSYVISNLASGTWYFAMTSYDAAKTESDRSAWVMVTL